MSPRTTSRFVSAVRSALTVWWVQWLLGIAAVVLALLPWLTAEPGIQATAGQESATSLLPPASKKPHLLFLMGGASALLTGLGTRLLANRRGRCAVLCGLGLLTGWTAAIYQSWTVLRTAALDVEQLGVHLGLTLSMVVGVLVLHAGLSLAPLGGFSIALAVLSLMPGYWLGEVLAVDAVQTHLDFLGPIMLGIALGYLGFARGSALLLWCAALLVQWIMPAVLSVAASFSSSAEDLRSPNNLWAVGREQLLQLHHVYLGLGTLATAMLLSVILLFVRRARHR